MAVWRKANGDVPGLWLCICGNPIHYTKGKICRKCKDWACEYCMVLTFEKVRRDGHTMRRYSHRQCVEALSDSSLPLSATFGFNPKLLTDAQLREARKEFQRRWRERLKDQNLHPDLAKTALTP